MALVGFSIYLARPSAEAEVLNLLPNPIPVDLPGLVDAQFSLLPSEPHIPPWFTALSPYLLPPTPVVPPADGTKEPEAPVSQTPAALLSCRVGTRLVLIAFGSAHAQVKKSLFEAHFGRRVAMNSVPPSAVVELQSRQVFAAFHRLSERAPGATRHRNFGVEGDRDLLAVVEGIAKTPTDLGHRVRGATPLSIEIEPNVLPKALAEAVHLFSQPNKFAEWSELDNLTPVVDEDLVRQLTGQLGDYLATRPKGLMLAAPWEEDLATATLFHIGRGTKTPALRPLLYPAAFYDSLPAGDAPTIEHAKRTGVHFYNSEKVDLEERTNVYECICYETTFKGLSYVLWSGRWYEANIDFVKRVHDRVRQIVLPTRKLPNWNGTDNEDAYNKSAGRKPGFKNLDKSLVYFGGGQSKFEHCDVLHEGSKTLYFVKQYSASSTMSHLVEQVRRTAELFFSRAPAYRTKMKKAGFKVPKEFPRHGDWNLCLVVMGRELTKLPLFAQCGIARLVTDLERNQHAVTAQSV